MKGKPSKKLLDILAAMTDNNEHGEVLSRIASETSFSHWKYFLIKHCIMKSVF